MRRNFLKNLSWMRIGNLKMTWDFFWTTHLESGMAVQTCNPGPWEAEARELKVQVTGDTDKFHAIFGYLARLCLKTKKQNFLTESRPQSTHVLCPQCLSPSFDNHAYLPIPHQSFLSMAHGSLGEGKATHNSSLSFPLKTLVTHLIVKSKHKLEAFQKRFCSGCSFSHKLNTN